MITVTQPFFPPREMLSQYIDDIYDRKWLTNNGPLLQELEHKLGGHLNVDNCRVVANGTLAIQIAIKALELKGEIITTAFSYVATTSSIVWEGCRPVFVDIDAETFNIDPTKIEAAITPETRAILATHIFGIPCDVVAIQEIADRHNLKVIYDAAHAFGVKVNGRSIFSYGDISTCSFHATKLFHTVEGGGIFANTPELDEKIRELRNFGHLSPVTFGLAGINAKVSEMHAAVGLCNLNFIDELMLRRQQQFKLYHKLLSKLPLVFPKIPTDCTYNFSYFAIVVESEEILLRLLDKLLKNNIQARRYFYPSLSTLPYTKEQENQTPFTNDICRRIACLPLYHLLQDADIKRICTIVEAMLMENPKHITLDPKQSKRRIANC